MASITLRIHTDATGEPTGGDSAIMEIPDELFIDGALNVKLAGRYLRRISELMAANLKAGLHHADWFITSDPEFVRQTALTYHDCAQCRAGADAAVGYLAANPGKELLVGQLWWR